MRLVRFGAPGAEKPGILDDEGRIRDLSGHTADFARDGLSPERLAHIAGLDRQSLPMAPDDARIGPPVGDVRNFIGIGLNYADHAAEAGLHIPSEPVVFNKLANCIIGPNDDVMQPRNVQKMDWEVELAFVIGQRARYVEKADAMRYIAGFCICNDVSERHFQLERSGQWAKGKCCETFGPLGPWLVTPDEVDVANLGLWLDVNGERRQTGSTATMIFDVPYMLSYVTQFMVLEAGDVVTTGTPPGVALGMKEPKWLQAGDVIRLGIDGLGEQCQRVVPFKL
ncbi:Ureidoglycolate lyase [Candidatus Filomicrobium marinum]|uniref:Ureidoglycolate lyase n=1 Tax=Candidatus Filomicrobium marinum TaxID=1608628 RepID=A0A0D6JDI4_9HYPH|nr:MULTISPECIES: fumarylacetoacetate hydrolase family protein [Filomicrobium]MCV0368037.1 fumarylacetoacetate hydrolase family protein [Filomicrobium sp.]CFX15761.1 Ureidoglycolate lyase [Candidatus Filomicrobium marinum]CPR18008.1 Ureidoglycolate lyase [Candidatus Filomicrobium marinum]